MFFLFRVELRKFRDFVTKVLCFLISIQNKKTLKIVTHGAYWTYKAYGIHETSGTN